MTRVDARDLTAAQGDVGIDFCCRFQDGLLGFIHATLKIQEVIGILIRSAAWYNQVKQQRARLVLGWVTVFACQFLVG